jgi:hypothetical protein
MGSFNVSLKIHWGKRSRKFYAQETMPKKLLHSGTAVVVRIHMLQKWNARTFSRKDKFHTEIEAIWMSKPQNIQNFPAFILHFLAETTCWSKFFYNTDVVRGFSEQWKWKPLEFYFRGFDVYFAYFNKYVDLLDKLEEVQKSKKINCVGLLLW